MAVILIIIFGNLSLETKNILQSLTLVPFLRIISLSILNMTNNVYLEYILLYGILITPILVHDNDNFLRVIALLIMTIIFPVQRLSPKDANIIGEFVSYF